MRTLMHGTPTGRPDYYWDVLIRRSSSVHIEIYTEFRFFKYQYSWLFPTQPKK